MTEHKFTDDEIIKAFEVCEVKTYPHCSECPLKGNPTNCRDVLHERVFQIINRQKAEIERLQDYPKCAYQFDGEVMDYCLKFPCSNFKTAEEIKSEAIKEFAERLKAVYTEDKRYDRPNAHTMLIILFAIIDNLVKEMTGEPKSPPHEICVVCGDQVPEGRQVCHMCETGQEFLNKKKE